MSVLNKTARQTTLSIVLLYILQIMLDYWLLITIEHVGSFETHTWIMLVDD